MSKLSKYDIEMGYCEEAQTYCSIAEDTYKQIRAEVLDEIMKLPKHNHYDMCNELMYQSISVEDIKQLKEKKNE